MAQGVSIHARAWRATFGDFGHVAKFDGFNSRPRVAGDAGGQRARDGSRRFNSRPRVAGDSGVARL